jgi:hypothetical protein
MHVPCEIQKPRLQFFLVISTKYSHQETPKKVKNTICPFFLRSRFFIPNSQPYRAARNPFWNLLPSRQHSILVKIMSATIAIRPIVANIILTQMLRCHNGKVLPIYKNSVWLNSINSFTRGMERNINSSPYQCFYIIVEEEGLYVEFSRTRNFPLG